MFFASYIARVFGFGEDKVFLKRLKNLEKYNENFDNFEAWEWAREEFTVFEPE